MDEDRFRGFQAVMKVATALGAVLVFFVGVGRWHAEQAQLIETRIAAEQSARDREFRRELWLRQVDVLGEVADASSRIAAYVEDDDAVDFSTAVRDYERLYWSNITFVDSTDLVQAMDALRNEIRLYRDGLLPLSGLNAKDRVKQRAHGVAEACRTAIRESGLDFVSSSLVESTEIPEQSTTPTVQAGKD